MELLPACENYKLLAIPRTLIPMDRNDRRVFKPVGFNVRALTAVMNEHLQQASTRGMTAAHQGQADPKAARAQNDRTLPRCTILLSLTVDLEFLRVFE